MTTISIRLGVISALHQEQAGLIENMTSVSTHKHAMRHYVEGKLGDLDCVFVLSRIGKVAAAATVTTLIERFKVTHIVFTGVAGAADASIGIGDVVVADRLIQHDMDASPLFPRFEIPLTGQSHFLSALSLTESVVEAVTLFLKDDMKNHISVADRDVFFSGTPRVHRGLIASGDSFIHCQEKIAVLKQSLPDLLAVEMEGAAVAQVCFEFGVPFAVIRTISDNANEHSPTDFMRFIDQVASIYAFHIIQRLCILLRQ
jgi:adenosylhomocysteine nucleosidase